MTQKSTFFSTPTSVISFSTRVIDDRTDLLGFARSINVVDLSRAGVGET